MNPQFVGTTIIQLDSVDSTNNFAAKKLIEGELAEGTAIMASFQFQGKGQRGAYWQSTKGLNLLFSLIFYPKFLKADRQFYLSKIISISIAEFLQDIGLLNISIKWPNDILADGMKIAGILIENSIRLENLETSIIGIGINVNEQEFKELRATSILLETGRFHPIAELSQQLFQIIQKYYELLQFGNEKLINERYTNLLFGQKRSYKYLIEREVVNCKVERVSLTGELYLNCENEILGPFGVRELKLLLP